MTVYNEIDPFAAAWLRELIRGGHIAGGVVNEQSIVGLDPVDVATATQFHTFAGIGVWSHALRLAGWPDDRPVWTGSCPCQPFSAAGKRGGFEDERHLWPAWFRLIRECRPPVIFGEQVASKDGLAWLDAVYADLEGAGYAVGAVDLCAAGVGAPHIRQRLFFVAERLADTGGEGLSARERAAVCRQGRRSEGRATQQRGSASLGVGNTGQYGDRKHDRELHGDEGEYAERSSHRDHASIVAGAATRLEHAASNGRKPRGAGTDRRGPSSRCGAIGVGDADRAGQSARDAEPERAATRSAEPADTGARSRPGPTNGHWRDADWLFCRDGKWRPVEPGTFPLAHGAPARVGRLRGYGNAIVAQAAAEVIRAYMATEAARAVEEMELNYVNTSGGVDE